MGKKIKPMCKRDKEEVRRDPESLKHVTAEPEYVCRKCGRVAMKDHHLCKPEKTER